MRLVLLGSLVTFAAAAQAGPAQPSARASVFEDEALPEQQPLPEGEALKELPRDGGEEFNRLVFETSPYLRQHARNPVNWYPWGTEAFRTAAVNKKPVLLSVGYSTCHWCHVMEHESFEDPQIAALLNETFICVKVDREERPDIDAVYMQVTQAMTGRGGWPNTILMTPEGKPFFAGTYLPPRGRYGREGLAELTTRTAQAWRDQRDQLGNTADEIARILNERTLERDPGALSEQILEQGAASLAQSYDEGRGGFGSAPKFPVPHRLGFLLRAYQRDGDEAKLAMVLRQLDAMRAGGIWDHVGLGFHRYSTDANWFLPHFEKMLYDQALLTTAYVEAYQVTGETRYRQTASEILQYVADRLTAPEGGFYSAEDADSEGEEGVFYIWTPEELKEVLGEADGQLAIDWFGVEAGGNYIDEGSGKKTGSSVLHTPHGMDAFAAARGLAGSSGSTAAPSAAMGKALEGIRQRLYEVREQRERPFRDDKILTDWNGLAIAAHAQAGRVFGEEQGASYVRQARRAADFVRSNLRQEDGRLYKLWRAGEASGTGMLDDYAFLAHGLVELYTTTFDEAYLAWSLELCDLMLELFWDEANGGLFLAPSDGESLMLRPKQVYDGATPSGNSVAALTFVRLARLTGRTELEDRARAIFHAFGGEVNSNPAAHSQLLMALDYLQGPTYELVVAAPGDDHAWDVLEPLQRAFLPRVALLSRPAGEEPAIAALAAFTKEQRAVQEKATLYLCQDFTCEAPTTDVQGVLKRLQGAADEEQ